MPLRTTANKLQRKFFEDLSLINKLVFTTKHKEFCSMNAQGSFELFDKYWDGAEYPKNETMIALKENAPMRILSEPPVHLHIDWNEVRYVAIRQRHLELINVDYEIVFCREPDLNSRIFWFYIRNGADLNWLVAKWGSNWNKLSEKLNTNHYNVEIDEHEYSLSQSNFQRS